MSQVALTPGNVLAVISDNSEFDFRTTDSLVKQFGVTRASMLPVLDELWHQGKIRHPVGWENNIYGRRNEAEWWRYTSHGYTRAEKRRMTWAVIGFSRLSNGSVGGGDF